MYLILFLQVDRTLDEKRKPLQQANGGLIIRQKKIKNI